MMTDPHGEGLGAFVIRRLGQARKRIEPEGRRVRFSGSRGPLNIASFLTGPTGFGVHMRMDKAEKISHTGA